MTDEPDNRVLKRRQEEDVESDHSVKRCKAGCDKENSIYGSNIIRILIGLGQQEFFVHQEVLVAQSTCFNNTLRHDSIEKATNTIKLPEDDPHIFGKVCEWLYARKVAELSCQELFDVYIFADIYGIVNLRNYSVDHYLKSTCLKEEMMASDFMRYLDERTANPRLKEAMCVVIVAAARFDLDVSQWENLSPEHRDSFFNVPMLIRLAVHLSGKIPQEEKSVKGEVWKKRCRYHEHENGQRCNDYEDSDKE